MKESDLKKYCQNRETFLKKMEKCAEGFIVSDGEIIGRIVVRKIDPELFEELADDYEDDCVEDNPLAYH